MKIPGAIIGIHGGGQLARLLAEAALKLGLSVKVYARFRDDAAAQLPVDVIEDRATQESLKLFLQGVDRLIFENEFLDLSPLRKQLPAQVKAIPNLDCLEFLSSKLNQKNLFSQLGIPTARFEKIDGDASARLLNKLQKPRVQCMLKWSKFGYDGYGNLVIRSIEDIPAAEEFIKAARAKNVDVYAEEFIEFSRELAISAIRDSAGNFFYFPAVVTEQKNGACRYVSGPASIRGLNGDRENQLRDWVRHVANKTRLVGAITIEFFEGNDGKILANEIAPRVHNSAHYSQWACEHSQFENHIRAAVDWPIQQSSCSPAFGMINLLGPEGMHGAHPPKAFSLQIGENILFYWYGKTELRPGRKMGHINIRAKSLGEFEENWAQSLQLESKWWATMTPKALTL